MNNIEICLKLTHKNHIAKVFLFFVLLESRHEHARRKTLHWLPVKERITSMIAIFAFCVTADTPGNDYNHTRVITESCTTATSHSFYYEQQQQQQHLIRKMVIREGNVRKKHG